jgi:hypothetical protein
VPFKQFGPTYFLAVLIGFQLILMLCWRQPIGSPDATI